MPDVVTWSQGYVDNGPSTAREQPQTTGAKGKATLAFTLHFHLDDGTVKDVPCVGTILEE